MDLCFSRLQFQFPPSAQSRSRIQLCWYQMPCRFVPQKEKRSVHHLQSIIASCSKANLFVSERWFWSDLRERLLILFVLFLVQYLFVSLRNRESCYQLLRSICPQVEVSSSGRTSQSTANKDTSKRAALALAQLLWKTVKVHSFSCFVATNLQLS